VLAKTQLDGGHANNFDCDVTKLRSIGCKI